MMPKKRHRPAPATIAAPAVDLRDLWRANNAVKSTATAVKSTATALTAGTAATRARGGRCCGHQGAGGAEGEADRQRHHWSGW